jgi:hypothetical protein
MIRRFSLFASISLGVASLCIAASDRPTWQNSSKPASDSSKPASQSSPTQAPDQATPAQGKSASPAADESLKKKPKKVWTNEEMATVRGGVSVVGSSSDPDGADLSSASSQAQPANYDRLVKSYLDKLAPLRVDLADIDRHIQNAKVTMGNASEDTAAYIRVYQEKRRNVLARIDAIEEEAHRHGVQPGDLR